MHQGSKVVVSSNSKKRKTMALMDLALALASGSKWWGFQCKKTRVLYVNLELQRYFFRYRRQRIAQAKGLAFDSYADNFHHICLRGYCDDAAKILPKLADRNLDYGAIILDPSYKLMGGRDENKAGDIGLLLNEFEKLAVRTGAMVVSAAHFSKGNQASKDAIDGSAAAVCLGETLIQLSPQLSTMKIVR
jgi:RecA-family ATPase